MINYFNFQKFKNKYLITNDLGRYDFLDVSQFVKLLTDDIPADSEDGKRLREKYLLKCSTVKTICSRVQVCISLC